MRRRRSLRVVVLLALLFAVTAGAVYAAFEWCDVDPVLDVGGKTLTMKVYVPEEVLPLIDAQHPIRVMVRVPKHLLDRTSRIDSDSHCVVDIRKGKRRDVIKVRVDAPEFRELDEYEVMVTVEMPALGFQRSKSGESDDPITIRIKDPAIKDF